MRAAPAAVAAKQQLRTLFRPDSISPNGRPSFLPMLSVVAMAYAAGFSLSRFMV